MKTTNTKIKNRIITLLFLGISFSFFCQAKEQNHSKKQEVRQDKVKNLKIAFFTSELNLSVNESEKFWPVYNEMEEKLKNIRQENKKVIDQLNDNSDNMKEDEYKKGINSIFDSEIQEANIKKEYFNKISTAIGYKKAGLVLKVEKEFKHKLLDEMKGRENGSKPPRPPHHE